MIWFTREPDPFTRQVIRTLRRMYPAAELDVIGPRDVLINGRSLALSDLYRMMEGERGTSENEKVEQSDRDSILIEHYLKRLIEGASTSRGGSIDFNTARSRIMPRLRPAIELTRSPPRIGGVHQRPLAGVEYVNDTVITFVIHDANGIVDVTRDDLTRWGVSADDVDTLARDNLVRFRPEVEAQFIQSADGGRVATFSTRDGYDAERLLLDSLFDELCAEMRGDFYVAVPARDIFFALTLGPEPFVQRLQKRFDLLHRTAPEAITSRMFVVTRDGVAGTMPEKARR